MKNFILDTNVLLHDPQALFKFQDNNIIIPITVIEEIDRFKKDMNETGRNARQMSRILDTMREKGSLATGIAMPGGGILRVVLFTEKYLKHLPVDLRVDSGDNRILSVAMDTRDQFPDIPLIFVTKDSNLRIKSDAIGLIAEDYESDKVDIQELYSGTRTIEMPADEVDRFYGQGWLEAPAGTSAQRIHHDCGQRQSLPHRHLPQLARDRPDRAGAQGPQGGYLEPVRPQP